MMLAGRRAVPCLVLALLMWSGGIGAAAAAANDLFTVAGVPVDATAESAAAARNQALAEGQRRALRDLLQRLTLKADWPRLPTVDGARLLDLVQGIEIGDERTAPTRYIANLTVSFRREGVRELLQGSAIPFAEAQARPMLVVPLLVAADGPRLWQDNPWATAWLAKDRRSDLVPLVVPAGDAEDVAILSPEQALAGDPSALAALGRRYGVGDVLVSSLVPGVAGYDLKLERYGDGPLQTSVESLGGEPTPEAMAQAAAGIAERLDEQWKRQTVVRLDDLNQLVAAVPFESFAEWQQVRRRLSEAPGVRRFEVASLTRRGAQVVVDYFGDPGRLALGLAQRDLELTEGVGAWTLRLRGAGRPPPAANQ